MLSQGLEGLCASRREGAAGPDAQPADPQPRRGGRFISGRDQIMAKGQMRSNKEAKKPKKDKVKPAAAGGAGPTDGLSISKMQGKSGKK